MVHEPESRPAPHEGAGPRACYRHPDRPAGVSCTRCDRPVCPDCMVEAPVGHQCPECVREGSRTVRRARTVFGGRPAENTRLVTMVLIGINLAVFLLVQAGGKPLLNDLLLVGRAWSGDGPVGVAEGPGQWYRLLTAVFLHWEITHIGFNMLSLYWLGPQLEASLGRARFLALYLLSGLGGAALSFLLAPPNSASLGASGAIFGLLGATVVMMRRMKYDLRPIMILLALNLVFTFTWPNIDWRAHIGGLVTGAVVALGMMHAPRGAARPLVQWGTCAVVLLAIVGTVWAGTVQITG
ncbi:rhomboid family intramembrane serine protease [Streptomyces sp. NPDC059506]|uniref:rhomboid family intramembrane serine protease n=1 Tax=Streptomyces TaxID=1883 RepID=UPI002174FABE|nr:MULTISPECIES: rhomboid family intramembrane serine protease [unclassified Streptomyces]MCZ2524687.1 rhomboid family intramembrane serine protease [Streptomyces sp. HB2AG]